MGSAGISASTCLEWQNPCEALSTAECAGRDKVYPREERSAEQTEWRLRQCQRRLHSCPRAQRGDPKRRNEILGPQNARSHSAWDIEGHASLRCLKLGLARGHAILRPRWHPTRFLPHPKPLRESKYSDGCSVQVHSARRSVSDNRESPVGRDTCGTNPAINRTRTNTNAKECRMHNLGNGCRTTFRQCRRSFREAETNSSRPRGV